MTIRLLEAIAVIARYTRTHKDRAALCRHTYIIRYDSQEAISEELDRKDIEQQYQAVVRLLEQDSH